MLNKEVIQIVNFIMLIGLPGSGKSYLAEEYKKNGYVIHSSDAIREELTGDINDQGINDEVFRVLHRRVKESLAAGVNCVYDATNIHYKRRKAFLAEIKKYDCSKEAILVATPYEVCLKQNEQRERKVPVHVIDRMYKQFDIPYDYEGWDKITIHYNNDAYKTLYGNVSQYLFDVMDFDQQSKWHTGTLGEHSLQAGKYIEHEYSFEKMRTPVTTLYEAALLHDCGKPFTKSFEDSKGNVSDTAHYYNHDHVGSYNSLFYETSSADKLYIATLIRWHMQMYFIDKQPHLENKYRELLGMSLWRDLGWIHDADKEAH